MKRARRLKRLCMPADLVLTPRILAATACLMETKAIEDIADALIDELDRRAGDCDLEPEDDAGVDDLCIYPRRPATEPSRITTVMMKLDVTSLRTACKRPESPLSVGVG